MKYERLTERRETPLKMSMWGGSIKDLKVYNRLAELEDKIEQGTIIELPCKVGDEVYIVTRGVKDYIESGRVTQFCVDENGVWVHFRDKYIYSHCIHSKSKGLCFTREEAEKRLKELQG